MRGRDRGRRPGAATARRPTEFELLTAVVFALVRRGSGVDLALVEVGLGGRLDATHAWDGGVAAITNVDLDHMDRLGPTIAAHRPREGRDHRARRPGGDRRHRRGARRSSVAVPPDGRRRSTSSSRRPVSAVDRDGLVVELPRLGGRGSGSAAGTRRRTSAVADAILDALAAAGIADVPDEARRRGYADARWPGRLELLTVDGRDVLLDGAHNPAGAAALADRARRPAAVPRRAGRARRSLTASMADKDVAGVVAALARRRPSRDARVIATPVDLPRALPAAELADGLAAVAPGDGDRSMAGRTSGPRWSGRWPDRRARSSWPARSISSGRSGRGSSTTRCCATRRPGETPRIGRRAAAARAVVARRLDAAAVGAPTAPGLPPLRIGPRPSPGARGRS